MILLAPCLARYLLYKSGGIVTKEVVGNAQGKAELSVSLHQKVLSSGENKIILLRNVFVYVISDHNF